MFQWRYEALSYYWGDPTPNRTLYLNNVQTSIHGNLYSALSVLVRQRPGVPIWTDALCIDQEDAQEKASQIQLMFEIYKGARHVWAWLGEATEGDGVGDVISSSALIQTICEEMRNSDFRIGIYEERLPDPGQPFWIGLEKILFNSYFDRLWILQEAAAAQKVTFVAGDFHMSFDDMERLFSCFNELKCIKGFLPGIDSPDVNTAIFRCRKILNFQELQAQFIVNKLAFRVIDWLATDPGDIAEVADMPHLIAAIVVSALLSISQRQRCSDARDRIFALLGIMNEVWKMPVQLPWLVDESVENIYIEAFYFLSPVVSLSNLLRFAPAPTDSPFFLPSWCPDFSSRMNDDTHAPVFGAVMDETSDWAASSRKSVLQRGPDPSILALPGVRVGVVNFTSTRSWPSLLEDRRCSTLIVRARKAIQWLDECWAAILHHSTNESVMAYTSVSPDMDHNDILWEQFWRTLLVYAEIQARIRDDPKITVSDFHKIHQTLKDLAAMEDRTIDNDGPIRDLDLGLFNLYFLHQLDAILRNRTFFITEQQLLGLGPVSVSVGDIVWVFQGARIPSVVYGPFQQCSDDTSEEDWLWKYRGDAFLPSIMHGEAETDGFKLWFEASDGNIKLM